MLKRLKDKWEVSTGRLILILVVFATGGSLTGIVGRKIMGWTGIENYWIYLPIYIVVVTLVWPLMVLAVSIPFGQFNFFRHYINKLISRMKRNRGSKKAAE